jgi:hypothetical protein
MKKLLAVLLVSLTGLSAHSQTVASANILGYTKVEKLGNRGYSLIGVNFNSDNQTLSQLLTFTPTGSLDVNTCDRIALWNPTNQNFDTYLYYYYDGNYPDNEGWKLLSDFEWEGQIQDPVVPSGSGIWMLSTPSALTTNILIAGNVESAGSVTNSIVEGLNILANPYATAVAVNDLEFTPVGSLDINTCDRLAVWNPTNQTFETYLYYYYDGNYPANEGWKLLSDFEWEGSVQNPTIGIGQSFWYRAQSNLTWTATPPF